MEDYNYAEKDHNLGAVALIFLFMGIALGGIATIIILNIL